MPTRDLLDPLDWSRDLPVEIGDLLAEARDPQTTADQLHELFLSDVPEVRLAVVANPSVRRQTVEDMLHLTDVFEARDQASLAEAVLSNPSLPLWLLDEPIWLERQPMAAAVALACSAHLGLTMWSALRGHPALRVKLKLLRAVVAPPDAWRRLGLPTGGYWDLTKITLADDGVGLLALAPDVALESLDLSSRAMDDVAIEELAQLPVLAHLTTLVLKSHRVGDRGAGALARSVNLGCLKELHLGNNVGDEGVAALSCSTLLPSLGKLRLAQNRIGDEGARVLASSSLLPTLSELSLSGNPIGPEGQRLLREAAARHPGLTLEL